MAGEDSVFDERRVREVVIPSPRQMLRGDVDRQDLAERMYEALYDEVDSWPEVDEIHKRALELEARQNRRRSR